MFPLAPHALAGALEDLADALGAETPENAVVEVEKKTSPSCGEVPPDGRLAGGARSDEDEMQCAPVVPCEGRWRHERHSTRSASADAATRATLAVHDVAALPRLHAGAESDLADLLGAADLVRIVHGRLASG